MLLHDNCITFFVNLQTVVIFHYKEKCTSCIVCFKCISIMADSDKTLIGDSNLSNNNRNPSVPNTIPASSENIHPETHPAHPVAVSEPSTLKRKQTSFQITSVTVQGSRLSTDGGEDSADDLDESHTEDASSDILDCSRTTDVDNDQLSEDNSNANNDDLPTPAPSIPAKCKVEKQPTQTVTAMKPPSETSVITPAVSLDKSQSESMVNPPTLPDQWQQRFRVVKIVSSEPFKRGRWLCMDFMDPPAPAVEMKQEVSESSPSSTAQLPQSSSFPDATVPADRVAHIYEISPNDAYPGSISVAVGPDQIQQPMYGIFLPVNNSQYPFVSGMHSGTMPLPVQKEVSRHESSQQSISAANQGMQQQQQQQNYSTGQPAYVDSQQAFACQQTQGLPTPTQQQHIAIHQVSSIQVCPQHQSKPVVKTSASVPVSQHQPVSVAQHTIVPTAPASQPQLVQDTHVTMQQRIQQQQSQGVSVSSSQNLVQISSHSPAAPMSDGSPMAGPALQNLQSQYHQLPNVSMTQTSSVGTQASTVASIPESSQAPSTQSVNIPETANVPSQVIPNHVDATETGTPPSNTQEVSSEGTLPKSDINGEDPESVPSGTNTVAIDNKIEQAMDLVKSHLMFAVREEVDVLKEKITELMDRISQLEHENGFLRANATQQTLEQLNQSQLLQQQQQQQQQIQPSSITLNSFPQVVQQPLQQQQLNVQNQQSTS